MNDLQVMSDALDDEERAEFLSCNSICSKFNDFFT